MPNSSNRNSSSNSKKIWGSCSLVMKGGDSACMNGEGDIESKSSTWQQARSVRAREDKKEMKRNVR